MMKHEFEALAGYEVSNEDYNNIIEPMYMATNLSKSDFVKCIDKKRFALKTQKQLLNEAKKMSKQLKETCEHFTDFDTEKKFDDIVTELQERFGGYWRTSRKHTFSEYRGCTFPAVIVHYDNNWNKIERFELCKSYWEE